MGKQGGFMDQAISLKEMMNKSIGDTDMAGSQDRVKVISVTSGKGGVGKTNVVVNLAFALAKIGKRVLILDADMGLGNLDIMLGLTPLYNLQHVINGEMGIGDVLINGPGGVMILPSCSGVQELAELTPQQKLNLLSELDRLGNLVDIMLIDTAAGISSNVMYFNTAAQDILVVASPEPTSLTDAYAVMKVLNTKYGECHFKLLVNMVKDPSEGREVYRKLWTAADRFLNISIDYIGYVLKDKHVVLSVMEQRSVVDLYPCSQASRCFNELSKKISEWPVNTQIKGNIQFMWKRLMGQAYWSKI